MDMKPNLMAHGMKGNLKMVSSMGKELIMIKN